VKTNPVCSNIPNDIEALWFVCKCFGIPEIEFGENWRKKMERAATADISTPEWKAVGWNLENHLFERFRRAGVAPASVTNDFTDEMVVTLLGLYERLRLSLDVRDVSAVDAFEVLIEHVFVPTLFLMVCKYRCQGARTEFHPAEFWYLPRREKNGRLRQPIPRVLDYWLRTAGLHTAYGLDQHLETLKVGAEVKPKGKIKRQVDRWLSGEVMPTLNQLYSFVDQVSGQVEWLDDAAAWKARFNLAYAVQKACKTSEAILAEPLGEMLNRGFREMLSEGIICDGPDILNNPHTFFAFRLLQKRLDKEKRLSEIVAPVQKRRQMSFATNVSDKVIEKERHKMWREATPGYWLGKFFAGEAKQARKPVDEYIFDRGIEELNRLLAQKRVLTTES
jgi:hypothetical protein